MEEKDNHYPQISEEEINKIVYELSDTTEEDFNDLTQQLQEIFEKEKRKAFLAGIEAGKKLAK